MEKIVVAAASVKNLVGRPDKSIENMGKWITSAAENQVELILFPELNVSGYITTPIAQQIAEPIPGPSTQKIITLAGQNNLIIGFGLIEKDADRYFCTHVLVSGDGVLGKQRKIHVPAHERPFWQAGNEIDVFDIGKAKVGITICRDSFFDEMTRTLYFKGAEILLMPFTYYNIPRNQYLKGTIHGMSLIKTCWTNGSYALVCNSAGERSPNEWDPKGRKFPGWAGAINPWGGVMDFIEDEGNDEAMIIAELDPAELEDRRHHPNFLAAELRPELYRFA